MAKTSSIERNKKRERLAKKFAARRARRCAPKRLTKTFHWKSASLRA
jgi:hypothetical protein